MNNGSLKIFTGNSNPELAQQICDFVGVPLGSAQVDKFPDGETFVQINENIRGADVFVVQATCDPANHYIMELLIMIDAMKRASAARITAVIPFYGYARQDRKDRPRVPITAKLVANLLVAAGANHILAIDFHAQQISGFFDIPVDHLFAAPVFYNYLEKYKSDNLAVFAPDVGGMKMAAAYADMLGCPMGMVSKRRRSAETVEAMNVIGEADGKDVLLVDDMTETGGTLVAAAKLLKKQGARSVRAAVSHGVLNEQGYERLSEGHLDELITTNSTPVKPNGLPITVLSIAQLIGDALIRIHHNESVTNLFKIKGF